MQIGGVKELKIDSTIRFHHSEIDQDLLIPSGANSIKWHYKLNTAVTPTIGGEVTQVLSAYVGPMTIEGLAPSNTELKRIRDWFLRYLEIAGTAYRDDVSFRDERAVFFSYPARGWSFYVDPTNFEGFRYDKSIYAVPWQVTAEIVSENALNYLSGVTMTAFTGPLANPAFIQVGYSDPTGQGKASMFVNPLLSADIPTLAKTMGDNFQRLVATFSTSGFQDFAFGTLKDNQLAGIPKDVAAQYTAAFGSPNIVGGQQTTGSGTTGSGSITYGSIIQNPTTQAQVVQDVALIFENKGIPAQLGVAIATRESSLDPNKRQEGGGVGIGLFQVSSDLSGRGNHAKITAGLKALAGGGKFTDGYPATDQIADAAGWFKQFEPFSSFDITNVDQMGQWAQAAQAAGIPYFANGHATDVFRTAWNQAATYLQATNLSDPSSANSAALAKQLLGYKGSLWTDDNSKGTAQLQTVAAGGKLNGAAGLVSLDPGPISAVLTLISRGYKVGTFAWCTDHSDDGLEGHAGGKAVDISSLNGTAINVNSQTCKTNVLAALNILHNTSPRQLISGGFGNQVDSACIALCLTDPRGQNPHSYYTDAVLAQHENHIHAGY